MDISLLQTFSVAPSVSLLTVLTVHSKTECRELMFTFTVYLIKVFIVWCEKCIIYRPTIHNYEQIIQNFSLRKHPFLLALRRLGRFARRNVCDLVAKIPYS